MSYVAVGLSHRTAPVAMRERAAVAEASMSQALALLRSIPGLHEGLLLTTCNRTEVYAAVAEPEREAARLREALAELADTSLAELGPHLYAHLRGEAVRHIFRVAASLDSLVVGESQILGQVKAAFAAAQAADLCRGGLGRLLERAFTVAKRVRTETAIGTASLSVGSVAAELAVTIFGALTGRSVLLIGAGKMGRLTLRHLIAAGVESVHVANRTPETAARLLEEVGPGRGFYVPLERVEESLARVDIALSSIQMGRFVLERDAAAQLVRRRRGAPLFLIDIAVPRSIEPRVHEIDNVFLYNLDDLEAVVARNLSARSAEATRAERIVEAEVVAFLRSQKEHDLGPAIAALRARLEAIRAAETVRHLGQQHDLDPAARAAIDGLTRAIVNKVAHGAITELKRAVASADGLPTIAALRRAFLLEATEAPQPDPGDTGGEPHEGSP